MRQNCDVVIVGGAVIGSAVAGLLRALIFIGSSPVRAPGIHAALDARLARGAARG